MKTTHKFFVIALILMSSLAATLNAQDLLITEDSHMVGEYTISGATVNASLITITNDPLGVASSGTNLFVVQFPPGSIGEYTTSGATVNASLITNLYEPCGIAISGTNLFVANYGSGTVGEYTTSGVTINALLITGLDFPETLAISGSNLFVGDFENGNGAFTGTIGEYTTSGATVKAPLISGLTLPYQQPNGIAISGNNLFVLNVSTNGSATGGFVSEYTTAGLIVHAALITNLDDPDGVAISGNDLFVWKNYGSPIDEYTTAGTTVTAGPFSGLSNVNGIAVVTPPVPQLNIATVGSQSVLFYPYSVLGTNYVLQTVTNAASTNWQTVSNGVAIIGVTVTNTLPASFFRLVRTQ